MKSRRKLGLWIVINLLLLSVIGGILYGSIGEDSFKNPNSGLYNHSNTSLKDYRHSIEDVRYDPPGPLKIGLRPNKSLWVDQGADRKRIPIYRVETNSYGFRDDSFGRKSNNTRIAVIGDSFTYGWGLNKSERFTEVAERKTSAEILNFGVPGLGIKDYYQYLKLEVLELNPDVVVVALRMDDKFSMIEQDRFYREAESKLPENSSVHEINKIMHQKKYEFIYEQGFWESPLPIYLKKIENITEKNDAKMVVYLIDQQKGPKNVPNYRELAKENEFVFINTPDRILEKERKKLIIRPGDIHFNSKANKILGEHLAEEINRYNLTVKEAIRSDQDQ